MTEKWEGIRSKIYLSNIFSCEDLALAKLSCAFVLKMAKKNFLEYKKFTAWLPVFACHLNNKNVQIKEKGSITSLRKSNNDSYSILK